MIQLLPLAFFFVWGGVLKSDFRLISQLSFQTAPPCPLAGRSAVARYSVIEVKVEAKAKAGWERGSADETITAAVPCDITGDTSGGRPRVIHTTAGVCVLVLVCFRLQCVFFILFLCSCFHYFVFVWFLFLCQNCFCSVSLYPGGSFLLL